ncbi:hypothetical protein [Candidatus Thiodictyon syntrophicum]|jgi:hypothetical protein|uniref:hypothetical protein n=1 Tax=Candidatus Thiodictyon syntrophicum TaxID=1166950 RepID=UPI001F3D5D6F|nr:hypothetical protein [Candidatus Thiodictyon syntrophicum]
MVQDRWLSLDIFALRDSVVDEYKRFATSFTTIQAPDIKSQVEGIYANARYWPEPLIQINPIISDAGHAYATLAPAGQRTITEDGQQFLPGHPDKRLYPVRFCRDCGHEYHPVRLADDGAGQVLLARSIDDAPPAADEELHSLPRPRAGRLGPWDRRVALGAAISSLVPTRKTCARATSSPGQTATLMPNGWTFSTACCLLRSSTRPSTAAS